MFVIDVDCCFEDNPVSVVPFLVKFCKFDSFSDSLVTSSMLSSRRNPAKAYLVNEKHGSYKLCFAKIADV